MEPQRTAAWATNRAKMSVRFVVVAGLGLGLELAKALGYRIRCMAYTETNRTKRWCTETDRKRWYTQQAKHKTHRKKNNKTNMTKMARNVSKRRIEEIYIAKCNYRP
jgi:hypothetical protein